MPSTNPSARLRNFDEISLGENFEITRQFTEEDVQQFARLSGDFSPLHVDPVYARTTEFGGCVVHGMLLASLFSQLVGMHIPGTLALYLGQDTSFRKPVLVGETVRAIGKVTAKNEGTRTIVLGTEIRNAQDKVVVSGTAKVKLRDTAAASQASPAAASLSQAPATGAVVLITGASRGIGAEIATVLAAKGAAVAVNYFQSGQRAGSLVDTIHKAGGQAVAIQADVRRTEDVQRLVDAAHKHFGRLDWVVNCAIGGLSPKPFAEMTWLDFQEHLDFQLRAVVDVCQAAYPKMKAAGGGAIVNILSQVVSGQPPQQMADYVAAKYALCGLSKALAIEWAADQIRVNMVSPGLIQTELTQHYQDRLFKTEASRTPLRRLATPADVANTVAFLLNKDASFLTGVNVSVTGGQVMI